MTWDAGRLSDGYEPRWDRDSAVGRQGELFVANVIDVLVNGRVEIKTDERARETGNVYVETSCHYPGRGWQPSGIEVTEAEEWVFVIGHRMIVIPTLELRRVAERFGVFAECRRGDHPTRGVVVPVIALVLR
jgi:hypothetical protein